MNSFDILAWTFDGGVYCTDCALTEEEGWDPVFADQYLDSEDMGGMCCDRCQHNLDCCNQLTGDMWDNCPQCERDRKADGIGGLTFNEWSKQREVVK